MSSAEDLHTENCKDSSKKLLEPVSEVSKEVQVRG